MPRDLFTKEDTLVGGYVPRPLAELFSLITLSENTSRSKVLLSIITAYVDKKEKVDVLIERVAKTIHENYLQAKQQDRTAKFIVYIETVKPWLVRKKINPNHIDKILKRVVSLHGQNKI